ncbi:thiamine-phosphate kinase [Dongia soli]|uniref:Thiamine-monophosphate kinase n=1 Tax=Dongia soli TaxID=600628 RepID=A0ABU5EBR2_9PROT|nr:thiamine-phosphate kinase [Dongia soli]MDY0883224.1 thiamine-phosphate kinase [Dongia soli]
MAGSSQAETSEDALPGEFETIRRYFAPLAAGMPGALDLTDDACTYLPPAGEELVLTADALVADVHFLRNDPADLVARKMLRVNLSDLAAKGAKPVGYLMTIAVDNTITSSWLANFARGLAEDQRRFDVHLMGGDTIRTPGPLSLSLTAIGTVPAGRALRRRGAQPGDLIFVTGTIGDGYLGLRVLRADWPDLSFGHRQFLTDRYQLPEPRLALGREIMAAGIATAAMDVSDGLVADLGHIAETSGCGAVIHAERTPLSGAAADLLSHEPDLLVKLITGGDDYELLLTIRRENAARLREIAGKAGIPVTELGEMTDSGSVRILDRDGAPLDISQRGYQHF